MTLEEAIEARDFLQRELYKVKEDYGRLQKELSAAKNTIRMLETSCMALCQQLWKST